MINRLYFLTAPLLTLLLFGCTESEQQKWEKKADWNFMMHTCNLSGGTIPIKSCDQQEIEEAAASLATVVSYNYLGPTTATIRLYVSPNHPYYNLMISNPKLHQVITANVSYIKGKEPNTLSIIFRTNQPCNMTENYRLAEPGKVYKQNIKADGNCNDDQKFIVEEDLKSGPQLRLFTKNN